MTEKNKSQTTDQSLSKTYGISNQYKKEELVRISIRKEDHEFLMRELVKINIRKPFGRPSKLFDLIAAVMPKEFDDHLIVKVTQRTLSPLDELQALYIRDMEQPEFQNMLPSSRPSFEDWLLSITKKEHTKKIPTRKKRRKRKTAQAEDQN